MPTYDIATNSLKEHLLKSAVLKEMEEYTVLPARVTSTSDYEKLQCVSVEVLIEDIYETKNQINAGTIKLEKIFVNLPRFADWRFRFPVSEEDKVTVYWSRKDLSEFLDGMGDVVTQNINEVAGLNDCFVRLEGGTRKEHNKPSLVNLEVEGKNVKFTVTPEGNISTETAGNIRAVAQGTYDIEASNLTIHNDTLITRNLQVEGEITSQGIVNALAGVYAATYAGTGGAAASFAVDMGITGTVTINGIAVNTHVHADAEGRDTGVMK